MFLRLLLFNQFILISTHQYRTRIDVFKCILCAYHFFFSSLKCSLSSSQQDGLILFLFSFIVIVKLFHSCELFINNSNSVGMFVQVCPNLERKSCKPEIALYRLDNTWQYGPPYLHRNHGVRSGIRTHDCQSDKESNLAYPLSRWKYGGPFCFKVIPVLVTARWTDFVFFYCDCQIVPLYCLQIFIHVNHS